MKFSIQQEAIFDYAANGSQSFIVEAVAGAGKTTTLVELVTRLRGNVAFVAYNKAIAQEIGHRLEGRVDPTKVKSGTFHSFGFGAWRRVAPKVKLEERKTYLIMEDLGVPKFYQSAVKELVSLAKQWAIGAACRIDDLEQWNNIVDRFDLDLKIDTAAANVYNPNLTVDEMVEEVVNWGGIVLNQSIQMAQDIIDFDDMIFMVVYSKNLKMWQNDWVLIDEAQDTNPARLLMARKMLRPNGRLVAVGDTYQAIYAFAGADSDSLDKIREGFKAITLPLTTTYRCPKAIVEHAREFAPHIEAHETAPDGLVGYLSDTEFRKHYGQLRRDDVVLCRNTAPLVSLAFDLIRNKVACHVEGRDIGNNLIALCKRWKVKTVGLLRERLNTYAAKEREKLVKEGREEKFAQIEDRVQTLNVIMSDMAVSEPVDSVIATINSLFGNTEPGKRPDTLTLSTVHKSKGKEWDRVYLYGRNKFMPSRYAKKDWEVRSESNLLYVAITRSKKELIEVSIESKPAPQEDM